MKTVTFDETQWKLVPVEPTEEMLEAVRGRAVYPRARELVDSDYRDMLAAAPQPEHGESDEQG